MADGFNQQPMNLDQIRRVWSGLRMLHIKIWFFSLSRPSDFNFYEFNMHLIFALRIICLALLPLITSFSLSLSTFNLCRLHLISFHQPLPTISNCEYQKKKNNFQGNEINFGTSSNSKKYTPSISMTLSTFNICMFSKAIIEALISLIIKSWN